jgi:hypothetical protein
MLSIGSLFSPNKRYCLFKFATLLSALFFTLATSTKTEAQVNSVPGASWDTALIDGLSKVVSKRAEQEIVQWYTMEMKKDICGKESKSDFFPNVCTLAKLEHDSPSSYPSANLLVIALRKDLENLPAVVIDKKKGYKFGYAVLDMYKELSSGKDPLEAAAKLGENAAIEQGCRSGSSPNSFENPDCAIYFSGKVFSGLKKTGEWIIFKDGKYSRATNFEQIARNLAANINNAMEEGTARILWEKALIKINITLKGKNGQNKLKKEDKEDFEKLIAPVTTLAYDFIKIANDLETIRSLKNDAREKHIPIPNDEILAHALTISKNIVAIIDNLAVIFQYDSPTNKTFKIARDVLDISAEYSAGHYHESFVDFIKLCQDNNLLDTSDNFYKYLSATSELAYAKNGDDVANIINEIASPVGAWRMKREKSMISFGALAGVMGGYEELNGAHASLKESSPLFNTYGAFAPVGIDISYPLVKSNYINSVGLFLSAIDIGQLVSQRVSSKNNQSEGVNSVNSNANVGFSQVVSPGAYFRLGLLNSPFVAGFGVSQSPKLRTASLNESKTGYKEEDLNSLRYVLFLAVDITLFPIW